jgi:hypothetical protein
LILVRPKIALPAAGALIALSTLLRPDGILLSVALIPAALAAAPDRKRRLTLLLTSLLTFSVVFAPWVVRNLRAFGQPHVFGGRVDRFTRPMPEYHGWWRWITSWGHDESTQTFLSTCFYNPPCTITPQMLPMEAFDSGEERATVDKLIGLRTVGNHNAEVSAGFEQLGAARQWHHPIRSFVILPLERAWHMWISRYDEVLQHPTLWPAIRIFGFRLFLPLTFVVSFALLFASAFLVWDPRTRLMALVLALPILTRTLILCFNNYSMPRYTVETWPLAYVLIAWAGVEVARRLKARQ